MIPDWLIYALIGVALVIGALAVEAQGNAKVRRIRQDQAFDETTPRDEEFR